MTYSRPSTRTVNALGDPGRPNEIGVRGSSQIQVSQNGRIYDNRNPGQILRNEQAKTAVVTNFIDTVTKAGAKLYKGKLQDQANEQMGELLATQDPEDLMRSTTSQEQRDVLRGLNPFARDQLETWQGEYGASQYTEIYAANREKNKAVLTNPAVPDDIKAQLMGDIKATALQESGLRDVRPNVLASVAPALARFEGQQAGFNYKGSVKRQRENDLVIFENGILSTVAPFLSNGGGEEGRGNQAAAEQALQQELSKNAAMWTPKEQASSLYAGLRQSVELLMAEENFDAAATLASRMLALSASEIKLPSGAYFFDVKDDQGKSLTLKLTELNNRTLDAQRRAGQLDAKRLVGDFAVQYEAAVTPEAKDAVNSAFMAGTAGLDAEVRASAISAWGSTVGTLDRPTELQIQNSANAMREITLNGLNKDQANARLLSLLDSGAITARQYAQQSDMIARGNPDKLIYEGIDQASKAAQEQIDVAVLDIFNSSTGPNGEVDPRFQGIDPKDQKALVESTLQSKTATKLQEKAKEARDGGNPWTPEQYIEEYKNEFARQAEALKKSFEKGEFQGKTRAQRINEEYRDLANNVSKGPLTVDSFSAETLNNWKRENPGKKPETKDLLGYLSNQLGSLKDAKGNPIYKDPPKLMKDLARKSRVQEDEYGFWDKFNPLNIIMGTPSLEELDAVGDVEKIEPDKKGDQSNATPAEGFKNVLFQGLSALSGVVERPAVAGTLEGKPGIEYSSASRELARVMSREMPLSIKTEPLPQVSAATPVRRASIAINNKNHPFFVAIGIAEGTRTPSGGFTKAYYGHTDPGDGNLNRGTVSGGRNGGGSPEQIDRQWMGILTSVSATMAPVLQRLGLSPNSQGWNRVMFNVLDLRVQAPAALQTFVSKLPQVKSQGLTVEAIAKARADSFFNPRTGTLEAGGFGNNYSRLFADQRSRAGVYDYKRRF